MQNVSKQYNEVTLDKWVLSRSKGQAWVVHLNGSCVDLVWFEAGCTAREVKQSLIYQDGYSVDIEVKKPS